MKKVLGILALVAVVAVFSTGCKKKCNCKMYEDGKQIGSVTLNEDQLGGMTCAAMTDITNDGVNGKNGQECK